MTCGALGPRSQPLGGSNSGSATRSTRALASLSLKFFTLTTVSTSRGHCEGCVGQRAECLGPGSLQTERSPSPGFRGQPSATSGSGPGRRFLKAPSPSQVRDVGDAEGRGRQLRKQQLTIPVRLLIAKRFTPTVFQSRPQPSQVKVIILILETAGALPQGDTVTAAELVRGETRTRVR